MTGVGFSVLETQGLAWHLRLQVRVAWGKALVQGAGREGVQLEARCSGHCPALEPVPQMWAGHLSSGASFSPWGGPFPLGPSHSGPKDWPPTFPS